MKRAKPSGKEPGEGPRPRKLTRNYTVSERHERLHEASEASDDLFDDLIQFPEDHDTPQVSQRSLGRRLATRNEISQPRELGIVNSAQGQVSIPEPPSYHYLTLSGANAYPDPDDGIAAPYLYKQSAHGFTTQDDLPYASTHPKLYPERHTSGKSTELVRPFQSRPSSEPQIAGNHHLYGSFGRYFHDRDAAKQYRRSHAPWARQPFREPHTDPTIAEIENDRQTHVERIYNAMIRRDHFRDNVGVAAWKRWVAEAHYPSRLVEAYAHKVFDSLLQSVKEGYNGYHNHDFVDQSRRRDEEDREVNCAGRLDNIIRALELEKTICEDVMLSSTKTRTFVNAPRSYMKRKEQNRNGNAQRPKSRPTGVETTPPRRRKTGTRHSRALSATGSVTLPTRDVTPPDQGGQTGAPYSASPQSLENAMSPPNIGFSPPQASFQYSSRSSAYHDPASSGLSPFRRPYSGRNSGLSQPPNSQLFSHVSPPARTLDHYFTPEVSMAPNPSRSALRFPYWQGTQSFTSPNPPPTMTPLNVPGLTNYHGMTFENDPLVHFGNLGRNSSANLFDEYPELGVDPAESEQHPPGADPASDE